MKVKNIYIAIILFISTNQIFAQSFSGKLIYKVVTDDSLTFKEAIEKLSLPLEMEFENSYTLWIKKDSLKSLAFNNKGEFGGCDYQNMDSAFTILKLKNRIQKLQYNQIKSISPEIKFRLMEKGKNNREILGYDCKEYIYYSDIGKTIVWIPDDFHSKEFYRKGKFFKKHFYPDGLAFRGESYVKDRLISSSELTYIKIYDVPNEELEVCNEEALLKNQN